MKYLKKYNESNSDIKSIIQTCKDILLSLEDTNDIETSVHYHKSTDDIMIILDVINDKFVIMHDELLDIEQLVNFLSSENIILSKVYLFTQEQTYDLEEETEEYFYDYLSKNDYKELIVDKPMIQLILTFKIN